MIIIGISCILLLLSGIGYSCSYRKDKASHTITSLSGEEQAGDEKAETFSKNGEVTVPVAEEALQNRTASTHREEPIQEIVKDKDNSTVIYVHLCGEVMNSGVYEVATGSRVIDLIELAGGFTKEAAGDYINQALVVSDGQRIYIPSLEEIKELPKHSELLVADVATSVQTTEQKRININLADAKELMELPGVGEAKAASIIEYRNTNGSFQSIEDLMKIPGIKEGLFQKVSPHITVR